MAVVSVCEINPGRDGEWVAYNISGQYKPKYVRQFIAITDDNITEQFEILDDAGIPLLHDAYPEDALAICSSKRCRVSDDNPKHWIITVEYADTGTLVYTDIELDVGVHRYQQPFVKGYTAGNALTDVVLNSALMPFDPPPTTNVSYSVLNFTRYMPYVDLATMLAHIATYNDTLNQLTFHGLTARYCKMSVKGKRIREQDHYVIMYSYEIEYNAKGWDKEIMNRGFHYLPGGAGPGKVIMMPNGAREASPRPLAANGDKLAVGDTPTYKTFREFRTVDWTPLGLA